MKTIKVCLTLIVIFLFSFVMQQRVQAQYIVQNSVFGNGGSMISDTDYSIGSTAGQSVIGRVSDPVYNHGIGFWAFYCDFISTIDPLSGPMPQSYWLWQNYPNPFNPTTTIQFALPRVSQVTLNLFDIMGRNVMSLANKEMKAGVHRVVLNGGNISSGVYFYRLKADGFIQTKRLVLMK